MKKYIVTILFDKSLTYQEDVYANTKREAYSKAKKRLAKKLFKMSKLKNYYCVED
jgi:hypothetical protein